MISYNLLRKDDPSFLKNRDEVIRLDHKYFPYPWKTELWQSTLKEDNLLCITMQEENEMIGFCLFSYNPFEELAHLLKIVVHPNFRGQGLARVLHTKAQDSLMVFKPRRLFLEVAVNNAEALSLYKSLGYTILNEIKAFYSDGQSAYTMQKIIN